MIFNIALQYQSDPSGNYGGWKATCIGNNWNAAVSMLKQEYKVRPKVKRFCVKVTDYMRDVCGSKVRTLQVFTTYSFPGGRDQPTGNTKPQPIGITPRSITKRDRASHKAMGYTFL